MLGANEKKKTFGLLGRNISYSLSPVMHNAAFSYFNIPAEYKLFDIGEEHLDEFLRDALELRNVNGFNVTVPYKVRVREFISGDKRHRLDESAFQLGAVNTVSMEEGSMLGYNTDGRGFWESVKDEIGIEGINNIFVFGAGGASRAICSYLVSPSGCKTLNTVYVYDIDDKKIRSLEELINKEASCRKLVPVDRQDIPVKVTECELLVNATPLGTKEGDPPPFDPGLIGTGIAVYDLVYARETEIVKTARSAGSRAAGGLGMLINQGAVAFNIWTGMPLDEVKKVMREAVYGKIRGDK